MKENWKVGRGLCIVTDTNEGFDSATGHAGIEAEKYYGGTLICESVWRERDSHLIAAAPDMLRALQNLENDNGAIPQHAWKLVQDALEKAMAGTEHGWTKKVQFVYALYYRDWLGQHTRVTEWSADKDYLLGKKRDVENVLPHITMVLVSKRVE